MTTTPATDHAPRIKSRSVLDHSIPTGREEEWRFAPLDRLAGLHASGELLPGTIDLLVSGDGVDVQEVAPEDPRVASTLVPSDLVSARALASAGQAHVVRIRARRSAPLASRSLDAGSRPAVIWSSRPSLLVLPP